MQDIRRSKINVRSSDGTAIGTGNQVTVVKNEKHIHHHTPRSGGNDDGPAMFFGLVLITAIALMGGTYLFARHAPSAYVGLRIVAVLELIVPLGITAFVQYEDKGQFRKMVSMIVLATLGSTALHFAQSDYGSELTQWASASGGFVNFWCHLSDHDRQVGLLHVLTAMIGFGLGSLLMIPPLGAMIANLFGAENDLLDTLSSWGWIVVGGVLIVIASGLHTPMGWDIWVQIAGTPTSFFCPR